MEFFEKVLVAIFGGSGFAAIPSDWRQLVMIVIACVLLYMGIGKGFEPLLRLPLPARPLPAPSTMPRCPCPRLPAM